MSSTTDKGNELRDKIYALLFGLCKQNCVKERFVGGKKADVYYEEIDQFGDTIRCVIECKNYSSPLTNADIKKILIEYQVESAHFDRLFILTHLASSLTSQMQETLKSHRNVKLCTYVEFHSTVIDFRKYLFSSQLKFKEEGLEQYYVDLLDIDNQNLASKIDNWIESEGGSPVAILAEYGMGKTCFALKLVERYSDSFLTGGTGRIPIYIKLGEIVDKTNIESLICTMFSSTYPVTNFTYPIFKEMNRQGHLIIIYDGFDEMKHAMTASVFRSMFIELDSLVEGKSKVILLGRPNAFLSDNEQKLFLDGKEVINGEEFQDPNLVEYDITKIRPFDKSQLEYFLTNYLFYLQKCDQSSDPHKLSAEFLQSRLDELLSEHYRELINRPVHAKMIAKLAFSTTKNLEIYKRFHLYKQFIQMFFDREMAKAAREPVDRETRILFIQNLSWRLWKDGGRRHFSSKELAGWEKEYFDSTDLNRNVDMLRELLTGSILERKQNDYYFFSHRSFQEYLVASYLLSRETFNESEIHDIAKAVNDEIVLFIEEGDLQCCFHEKIMKSIFFYNGFMSEKLISYLAKGIDPSADNMPDDIFDGGPWYTFVHSLALDAAETLRILMKRILDPNIKISVNYLACMLALLYKNTSERSRSDLQTDICGLLHLMCASEITNMQINKGKIIAGVGTESQATRHAFTVLVSAFTPLVEENSVEARVISSSTPSLAIAIHNALEAMMKFENGHLSKFVALQGKEFRLPIDDMRPLIEEFVSNQLFIDKVKINQTDRDAFEEKVRGTLRKYRQVWGAKPSAADLIPITKSNENSRNILSLKK